MTTEESTSGGKGVGHPKVLVVEDEEPIREGLLELFRGQSFDPSGVEDGAAAMEWLTAERFDLVILDLMIPGIHGLEVLRRLRALGDDTPVLVLTARGAEDDVVLGLEAGADDYVTKPFGIKELVARANGLLRRAGPRDDAPSKLTVGDVTLDFDLLSISWPTAARPLTLTSREALLLQYLSRISPKPATREDLLVNVWGYQDGTVRTRTVDVHVQQLRAKLRIVPGGQEWIETVRGRGYRLCSFEAEG